MKRDKVAIMWSGGKDSTASIMLNVLSGVEVEVFCYIPMFTEQIPLLLKSHYEHIKRVSEEMKKQGIKVHFLKGITYYEQVTRPAKTGKNKGKCIGFPYASRGICHFKRDSKLKALNSVDLSKFDYVDIGIAVDEVDRQGQLIGNRKSILVDFGYTEEMAKGLVELAGWLSPQYDFAFRDGCVLCPFSKQKERDQWFKDYPEAIPLVIELQEIVKREKPNQRPLIGEKWFIE